MKKDEKKELKELIKRVDTTIDHEKEGLANVEILAITSLQGSLNSIIENIK